MIIKYQTFNESVRDQMKPISGDELEKAKLKSLGFDSKEELEEAIIGDGIDKIYHVYSGVDAFVYEDKKLDNGKEILSKYISVIATSEIDARIKAAKIIGQELYDQKSNLNYENWVSDHVEFIENY